MSKYYIATDQGKTPKIGFLKLQEKNFDAYYGVWDDFLNLKQIKGSGILSGSAPTEEKLKQVFLEKTEIDKIIIYEADKDNFREIKLQRNAKKIKKAEVDSGDEVEEKDKKIPDFKTEEELFRYYQKYQPSEDHYNEKGLNALHMAASNGFIAAIALLADEGYDLDFRSMKGKSPIEHAWANRQISAVKCLIAHGARYNHLIDDISTLGNKAARELLECFPEVCSGKKIIIRYENDEDSYVRIRDVSFNRQAIELKQLSKNKKESLEKKQTKSVELHKCHILSFAWIKEAFTANIVHRDYRAVYHELAQALRQVGEDISSFRVNKLDTARLIELWFLYISAQDNIGMGSAEGNLAKAWLQVELQKLKYLEDEKFENKNHKIKHKKVKISLPIPEKFQDWFKQGEYHCYLEHFIKDNQIIISDKHDFLELYQLSIIDDDEFSSSTATSKNEDKIFRLLSNFGVACSAGRTERASSLTSSYQVYEKVAQKKGLF